MKKFKAGSKSRLTEAHLPCQDCGSSDALSTYDDGHSYCFSCGKNKWLDKEDNPWYFKLSDSERIPVDIPKDTLPKDTGLGNSNDYTLEYISFRGISKDSCKKYSCKTRVSPTGIPLEILFPYGSGAAKVRSLQDKKFSTEGKFVEYEKLFGEDQFGPGSANAITITEGEIDCLSAFQMLGSKYPVVSVKGSTSARRDCERSFKYLNSFDKIYLCFDNDVAGHKAAKSLQGLFDGNKVYHVKLGLKDANEYLQAGKEKEFINTWWASKNYLPEGIMNSFDDIEAELKSQASEPIGTYPFPTLQDMSYGVRTGEIVLFTAQEKVGKTEIMRAIEAHLLKTTDHNMGIIHLEETQKRAIQGLATYELGVPCHLPDSNVSVGDQLNAFKSLARNDGRVHFYKHFGADDPDSVLDVIRYLVGVQHCKFVFLDHITMLVTGSRGDDERKTLDYISTRLAMMVKELDFCLFLVSHVNDDGKTRGSRNISKIADLLLHLDRDIEADNLDLRNQTKVTCRGNRFASTSGPAGVLWFEPSKYIVKELEARDIGGVDEFKPF